MENLTNYIVEYGHLTFDIMKFNEIDSLVLAQLAYTNLALVNFDSKGQFKLRDLEDVELAEKISSITWMPKDDVEMLLLLAKSPRYMDLKIIDFKEVEDVNVDGQFTGFTIQLNSDTIIIINRGTDHSFDGWAESLALSYEAEVPAQLSAKKYLEYISGKYPQKIIMIGHSKGGNLVVFAASTVKKEIQDRIQKVYNLDGPGFLPEFYDREDYGDISDKVELYIPRQSVFGLLLEGRVKAKVVDSKGLLFYQHYPYSWIVKEGKFVYCDDVDSISKLTNAAVEKWMGIIDRKKRKEFIEILFSLFDKSGAEDFKDVVMNRFDTFIKLRSGFVEMEEEKVNFLKESVWEFFKIFKEEVIHSIYPK